MKTFYLTAFLAFSATIAFFSSCSYNPGSSTPADTTHNSKLTFKQDYHAHYDLFVVDTADKNGNNPDNILTTTKIQLVDKVVDTGLSFHGKYPVVKIISYQVNIATDSEYFYQDPNGDLYRYNFGFSILNKFTFLTQAIGSNIDVGWVLSAKITSPEGTSWIARNPDTVYLQSPNIPVILHSQGVMMADTSFLVGTEIVKARHSRNTVTATALGIVENGSVIIDSYYSTAINAIVEDFFRHVTLTGYFPQQAQGKLKIMTSHD